MTTNIQKWLDIAVTHTYFPNGICEVLQFVPTDETTLAMKNYGLLSRSFSNLFSLYCATNPADKSSISQLLTGLNNLYFLVLMTDSWFPNYSDLPLQIGFSPNQFLFTNGENKSNPLALQTGKFVAASDLVTIMPMKFQLPAPAVKTVKLQIKDATGKVVVNQQSDGTIHHLLDINLMPFGSGKYTISVNKTQTIIFASSTAPAANCLGILQLKMADILPMLKKMPVHFSLSFDTRAAFWKYAVVIGADKQIEIKSLSIEGAKGPIYTGPVEEPVVGGATAQVYTSAVPIPFSYALPSGQTLKMSYANTFSERVQELDLKLPFPDISSLSVTKDKQNKLTFYASRIINI